MVDEEKYFNERRKISTSVCRGLPSINNMGEASYACKLSQKITVFLKYDKTREGTDHYFCLQVRSHRFSQTGREGTEFFRSELAPTFLLKILLPPQIISFMKWKFSLFRESQAKGFTKSSITGLRKVYLYAGPEHILFLITYKRGAENF